MGHAYDQMPIHKETDQAAMINRSMDVIEKFTGKRPVGWLGPGLTQTLETPELLKAAGVQYIGDWVYDDEPTVIKTEKGPLVTLPYTVELNDIPMMIVQYHQSDYLLKRTIDQFDRLYAESAHRAKIDGAGDPSLHLRPAAPHQVPRGDLRLREPVRGRAALERRADPRLVQVGRGRQAQDMSQDSLRISPADLHAFTAAIFVAAGLTPEHAGEWAKMLVWANLRGTDSHGIIRIPRYIDLINAKSINAAPEHPRRAQAPPPPWCWRPTARPPRSA